MSATTTSEPEDDGDGFLLHCAAFSAPSASTGTALRCAFGFEPGGSAAAALGGRRLPADGLLLLLRLGRCGAARHGEQGRAELLYGGVALGRIVSAGAHDDVLQRLAAVQRLGQRVAAQRCSRAIARSDASTAVGGSGTNGMRRSLSAQ